MARRWSSIDEPHDPERSASSMSAGFGRGPRPSLIARFRVTDRHANGKHVRFESTQGVRRTVWVPRGARRPQDLRPTDGGPPLGPEGADLLAVLVAADEDPAAASAFSEVPTRIHPNPSRTVGMLTHPPPEPTFVPPPARRSAAAPRPPVPVRRAGRVHPRAAPEPVFRGPNDNTIVAAIGLGAVLALAMVMVAAVLALL